jgi:hypothetical protein
MNKYIFSCVFLFVCAHYAYSQNIIEQIIKAYQRLDSVSYLEKASRKGCESLFGEDEIRLRRCYEWDKEKHANKKEVFLLNIDVDSAHLNTNDYVRVDTNEYRFSVVFLNTKKDIEDDLCFQNNESYPFFIDYTGFTYAKKLFRGYKKVFKRNPMYILYCSGLHQVILYVFDERIFVYQVMTEKTYELREYLQVLKQEGLE